MTKDILIDEYYKTLYDALNVATIPVISIRKDISLKLLLGATFGGGATEIAQQVNMDYETVLKKLDEIANARLINAVKVIVKDHPLILIIDDTHDHKLYARAMPTSRNCTQVYYCREHKKYEPAIQLLIAAVKDIITNEVYIISITPYVPRKVKEELERRGENVEFKTKIEVYLELLPQLDGLNVVGIVFDSWYVNSKTLLPNTVGELKSNARVVEGGEPVRLSLFPQGVYQVEYLGTPIKLLVIDDYKGYGRRYFFSTNLNDTPEDIITTWENRWDIEVLIRELKALGLEKGSFLTWVRNTGFITLKALALLLVLTFKYTAGLRLGAKRVARLIKNIYQKAGGIKKLFKRKRKT